MLERPTIRGTDPVTFEAMLDDLDDLTDKVLVYGRAGVPIYLLLDMQEELVTVLSTPSAKGYESNCTRPFGEELPGLWPDPLPRHPAPQKTGSFAQVGGGPHLDAGPLGERQHRCDEALGERVDD